MTRFGRRTMWLAALVVCSLAPAGVADARVAGPVRARSAQCTPTVTFGLIQATSACFDAISSTQWQSTGAVTLNGIQLTPKTGTRVTLTSPSSAQPGGNLTVDLATPVSEAGVSWIKSGVVNWNLPAGTQGQAGNVAGTGTLNGQALFGFAISGSAEIQIGWDTADHYWKFVGNLALPSIFKNGPGEGAGGLTATVGLRVDSSGVHTDAVKATVANAYVGTLQVKSLCLSYLAAGSTAAAPCSPPAFGAASNASTSTCTQPGLVNRWDGSAEVVLPTADRPSVGVWAGVQNGTFSYAGAQVMNLGNSLPIAQGVYVSQFGLALCVTPPPFKFTGTAGINIGPTVSGKAPISIIGSLQYVDTRPWVLEASGDLAFEGKTLLGGFLRYTSNNTIDFGFNANYDLSVASIKGAVSGWIEARTPFRFNVDGTGSVCVSTVACSSGEVTASTTGLAGCFTLLNFTYPVIVKDKDFAWYKPWKVHTEYRTKRIRGGAGYVWSTKKATLMGDSCDIGPYKAARTAQAARAGGLQFRVTKNTPALSLQAQGAAASPRIKLLAPGGASYDSPASGGEIKPGLVFGTDAADQTTEVEIARPKAGIWTVSGLGNSQLTGIQQAPVEEPPTVLASVGGKKFTRTLGYSYQPDPGHTIRFVEQGTDYEQELGPANAQPCQGTANIRPRPRCGEIAFTPDATSAAGTHQIVAIVSDATGEITAEIPVASYHAPAEPPPSRVPNLTATRSGSSVVITWGASSTPDPAPAARPADYNVDVNLTNGQELLDVVPAGQNSVTIPGVGSPTGVQVKLSAMRADDGQGGARVLTLAAGQASATS